MTCEGCVGSVKRVLGKLDGTSLRPARAAAVTAGHTVEAGAGTNASALHADTLLVACILR